MKAVIITIGDEILNGQTVDTNSAWLGRELNKVGIDVQEIRSISDEEEQIHEALSWGSKAAKLVLITGGLGPTRDDKTRKALAEFFGVERKLNKEVLSSLENYFVKRGRPLSALNQAMAELPVNCMPIPNGRGTAWGMWFEENGVAYVSMPGVPHEMKGMVTDEVLPRIRKQFELPFIQHKHLLTAAMPESVLSEMLSDFEDNLPANIKLAYLPDLGMVKLRLSARGPQQDVLQRQLNEQIEKMEAIIGKYVYGYDGDVFEQVIGELLREKGKTISTAESCTGGYLAHRITSVAGSSDYFMGSVISYANRIKQQELGVKAETLEKYGAVSEQTVTEMVQGAIKNLETDYAIATSGIAGPGGGTEEKPVGTVWIAVGSKKEVIAKKYSFGGNRQQNIELSAVVALEMLRKYLTGQLVKT